MGSIRWTFILILVLLAGNLPARDFQLKGWEYDSVIAGREEPVRLQDHNFIKATVLNGKIHLFYRDRGAIFVSIFENGKIVATREAFAAEAYTVPVVKEDGNSLIILAYRQGSIHFYRMTDLDHISPFYSMEYPLNFNYDVFILGDKFLVSLPVVTDGRYSIRVLILEKKGGKYSAERMDIDPIDKMDKGIFYYRIFKEGNIYVSYFIRRYYDNDAKIIGDSIFTFRSAGLTQIRNAKPVILLPEGISDHPPDILPVSNDTYILILRKRKAVYSLRLVSEKNRTEYALSKDFINSYQPHYYFRNGVLDLFYLGNLGTTRRIYHRQVDLYRLNELGYLENGASDVAVTLPGTDVSSISICSNGNDRYLFWINAVDRSVHYTKNDVSAPTLEVNARIMNENNKLFYFFTWKKPEDPSGVSGYAYTVDDRPDTVPVMLNLTPGERGFAADQLAPGRYFFHIRAVDGLGNFGPVRHLRFEAGIKDTSRLAELNSWNQVWNNAWLDPIDKALISIDRETGTGDSYQLAEYSELLRYYREISGNLLQKNYPAAKKFLDRCIVIDGQRMETLLYQQLIKKSEENVIYRNFLLIAVVSFLVLMAGLAAIYYGVSRK